MNGHKEQELESHGLQLPKFRSVDEVQRLINTLEVIKAKMMANVSSTPKADHLLIQEDEQEGTSKFDRLSSNGIPTLPVGENVEEAKKDLKTPSKKKPRSWKYAHIPVVETCEETLRAREERARKALIPPKIVVPAYMEIPELPLMKRIEVQISHVNSLGDFFVTRLDEEATKARIQGYLKAAAETVRIPFNVEELEKVPIGVYSEPGIWERVIVKRIEASFADVYLMDRGDTLRLKRYQVITCPPLMFNIRPLAYHCSLNLEPASDCLGTWLEILKPKFLNLQNTCSVSSRLTAFCYAVENGVHSIKLNTGYYEDYGSALRKLNLAVVSSNTNISGLSGGVNDNSTSEKLPESDAVNIEDSTQEFVYSVEDVEVSVQGVENSSQSLEDCSQGTEEQTVALGLLGDVEMSEDVASLGVSSDASKDENGSSSVTLAGFPTESVPLAIHRQMATRFSIYPTPFGASYIFIVPENIPYRQLKYKIVSFVHDSKVEEGFIPIPDEIVFICAPKQQIGRARVISVGHLRKSFRAMHIDSGLVGEHRIEHAVKISADIQNIPPLGYWVNISSKTNYDILLADFAKYDALNASRKFVLDDVEGCRYNITTVQMRCVGEGDDGETIENILLDMQQWRYELLLSIGWNTDMDFQTDPEIFEPQKTDYNCVDGKEWMMEDHRILQMHLDSFYSKVRRSPIDEFKVGQHYAVHVMDGRPGHSVKWHRTILESDNHFKCIDHAEEWDILPRDSKILTRLLYSEFLKVAPFNNLQLSEDNAPKRKHEMSFKKWH